MLPSYNGNIKTIESLEKWSFYTKMQNSTCLTSKCSTFMWAAVDALLF